jgi:tetratricopeptide (TPR) repeat protein
MTVALRRAERLAHRGYQLHKRGDLLGALELYQKARHLAPQLPDVLHHSALAARQLYQRARAKGLTPDPVHSTRLMNVAIEQATAIAMAVQAKDPAAFERGEGDASIVRKLFAAMLHNQAWLQRDLGIVEGPNGARLIYEEAVYGELGNRMRAEACWNRALLCRRVTPEARFNLAFLFLLRGDYETAGRSTRRAGSP